LRKNSWHTAQSDGNAKLELTLKSLIADIEEVLVQTEGEENPILSFRGKKTAFRVFMQKSFGRAQALLQQFQDIKSQVDSWRQQEKLARKATELLVASGLALNLIIAVTLALWFNKDISMRISTLVNNARLLPLRLKLAPPLTGSDELIDLHEAMRKTAAELEAVFTKTRRPV